MSNEIKTPRKKSVPEARISLRDLSPEDRQALLAELQQQTPKENDAEVEDRKLATGLVNALNKLTTDSHTAKFKDDPKYLRSGTIWTYYIANESSYDTFIGDLGGRGDERESVKCTIYAHSGVDLLSITSDEENIKHSNHLSRAVSEGGPLRRLTPDEWDRVKDQFSDLDKWRNTTTAERKKKVQDNERKSDQLRKHESRNDEYLRRIAKPRRPKILALAQRMLHTYPTSITEEEFINRVRTFGPINKYEHQTLLESCNEMIAPRAAEFMETITPIMPNEEDIKLEIQNLRNKRNKT